ncbi:Uncharacterised protein [Mycobacteroides abscessus subsp. abscessus]|nr:Uncharacterised protein [Mycobacteroides abscessus subsp. abscessus]
MAFARDRPISVARFQERSTALKRLRVNRNNN